MYMCTYTIEREREGGAAQTTYSYTLKRKKAFSIYVCMTHWVEGKLPVAAFIDMSVSSHGCGRSSRSKSHVWRHWDQKMRGYSV